MSDKEDNSLDRLEGSNFLPFSFRKSFRLKPRVSTTRFKMSASSSSSGSSKEEYPEGINELMSMIRQMEVRINSKLDNMGERLDKLESKDKGEPPKAEKIDSKESLSLPTTGGYDAYEPKHVPRNLFSADLNVEFESITVERSNVSDDYLAQVRSATFGDSSPNPNSAKSDKIISFPNTAKSYTRETDGEKILEIPKVDFKIGFPIVTSAGFTKFEEELKSVFGELPREKIILENNEFVRIESSEETELTLYRYCNFKYNTITDFRLRGNLQPIPLVSIQRNAGITQWVIKLFKYKFKYLLSDEFMWPLIRKSVEDVIGKTVKPGTNYLLAKIIRDDPPFLINYNQILDWNQMLEFLRPKNHNTTPEPMLEEDINRLMEWSKAYENMSEDRIYEFVLNYRTQYNRLIREGVRRWVPNTGGAIWGKLYPISKLMILAITNDVSDVNMANPEGGRIPKLFGINIIRDIYAVLGQMLHQQRQVTIDKIQFRMERFIRENNKLVNDINPNIKWDTDVRRKQRYGYDYNPKDYNARNKYY